ncbi:glycoside hydrolase family 18 protein [Acholeplasma hippikon]|uniref:chitinase n=1 Tax=Acholeplasma hippikon TaxID=264636 RepID=A0A449BL28_9MOLU|nr:glycoside hydrolase family 18 protein [Acholeplasma hippikon]VEU83132.1 Chitinase A1 precursor [Acholeplasma hippikon]
MKKILSILLMLLLIPTLVACVNFNDNSPKINVTVDLENYQVTEISDGLEARIDLLSNFISLTIKLDSIFSSYGLKVNGKTINKNKYTISNNELIYNFKAKDFMKKSEKITTLLKLNSDGGLWHKEDLVHITPSFTFDNISHNDEESRDITIFTNVSTGLRWYYKLFLKYETSLDIYKVVFVDPRDKAIEALDLPDYDFILALHYQNADIETNSELKSLFTTSSLNSIVSLDNDLETATTAYVYTNSNNEANYQIYLNEEFILPTPQKAQFDFVGWFDGVNVIETFTPYTAKTDNYVKELTAQYGGMSIESLNNYLNSIIPQFTDKDLKLPLAYSDYTINWESSNESVISKTGKFNNSFNDDEVTLTAKITKSDGSTYQYTYKTEVRMMKSFSNGIASGYIYRSYSSLPDLLFETLDIINAAFIDLDTNGNLKGTAYLNNVATEIMPRAKAYGNYVVLVVGPASEPSVWSEVARSQEKINRMADQLVEIINEYGFHGVDLDWETPTSSEKTNFTKLAKTVYEKVKANNPNHLVTAAIAGGQWQMPRYDLENSNQYLDYVNMMMYGLVNNGGRYQNPLKAATSWHNSTLQLGATTSSTSIAESVQLFNNLGVPDSKLIVGLAFYGIRQVRTKTGNTYGSFTNAGSVFYNEIVQIMNNPDYITAYDERASVPYIYKTDGTEFISFDNPRSIAEKAQWIKREGLAGLMFWEYGTDTTNILLEALKESMYKEK